MKLIDWHKIHQKKYTYLLWCLIIIFLTSSLFDVKGLGIFLINTVYYCIILFVLSTFQLHQRIRLIFKAVATLGFAFKVLPIHLGLKLFLLGEIIDMLFNALAIKVIMRKISLDKKVTGDTLRGGISIYLLLGLLWGQIYQILYTIAPHSFEPTVNSYQLFYFSFTTLTTLGYGDILPVTNIAMTLTNLEAIIGQMFPAIFIARLVSLYAPQQ